MTEDERPMMTIPWINLIGIVLVSLTMWFAIWRLGHTFLRWLVSL